MKRVALLLAITMVAAGCLATPADVDSATVDPADVASIVGRSGVFHGADGLPAVAPAGVAAALGAQFSLGAGSTEPTIGVTPDGVVFMTAYGKNAVGRNVPSVYRSTDKGQTWEDKGPGTHPGSFDPYVFVDPDTGRVYMDDIFPLSCTMLSWSDDQGESWTTNPYACGNSQVNDHQTIVTAWPRVLPTVGYPKIVYTCSNNVAYIGCATSLNGGLTFGPQVPVDHGFETSAEFPVCSALTAHLRAGPDGKVYLPKTECGTQASRPVVYVTEDDGLTWSKKIISDSFAYPHEIGFAIDEESNLYAFWPTPEGRQSFAYSVDGGDTWSEPRDVTAPGVTATMFTAAAAQGVGKVAFAYVGSAIENGYDKKGEGNEGLTGDLLGQPAIPEWDNATWNGYIGVIVGANTDAPVIQSVTANDPEDPLARGLCGRTRCSGMNDFIDMVVDAEGRPWVAFVDVCTQECVTDKTVHADSAVGFAGTLLSGPALITGARELAPLAPPPTRASE